MPTHALILEGQIVRLLNLGQPVVMPDTSVIMGWSVGPLDGGYLIAAIDVADEVPNDKQVVSSSVELVGGTPRWVHVLVPQTPPDRVTARQFKLQLLAAGLLDSVEAWVNTQPRAVHIAYANSGTFVRDEPMMQRGLTDLGFTPEQIETFFLAASKL